MNRRRIVVALLIAGGLFALAQGGWIHAKAALAQVLLQQAWTASAGGEPVKPWPWADTHPVARLRAPAQGVELIVLAGASGRTLAFGPGHLDGSAPPGATGHTVISGHRDSHFRFLERVAPGERIELERPDGAVRAYRVIGSEVVDERTTRLRLDGEEPTLTLVTCWPFDAVDPGGPLRYLVYAEAEPDTAAPATGRTVIAVAMRAAQQD